MSIHLTFWIKKDQNKKADYDNLIPILSISRNHDAFESLCESIHCGYGEIIKIGNNNLDNVLLEIENQINENSRALKIIKENIPSKCDYEILTDILQNIADKEEEITNSICTKGEIYMLGNVILECGDYLYASIG